jgi:hypothetical protein
MSDRNPLFLLLERVQPRAKVKAMRSIAEIEAAIEKLPAPQMDELAVWLDRLRSRRDAKATVESWLNQARGGALPGVTTADIMTLTRGEG